MIARVASLQRRLFCNLTPYDIVKGTVVFHNGRYVEILNSAASGNKKLKGMYKLEILDLYTNCASKEYFTYNQIEKLDRVDYTRLDVEFQYVDEDKQMLIFSDDAYNQHEVPLYLFRGHIPLLQAGTRFTLFMDGERYIRIL